MVRMNSNDGRGRRSRLNGRTALHLRALLAGIALLILATMPAQAQQETPLKTIEQFKQLLDNDNLSTLCGLMTENDGSGPLTLKHYEDMQMSLDGLRKMWSGQSFVYGNAEIDEDAQPPKAVASIKLDGLSQEVKFTLLQFKGRWYISDIEVFFK